MRLLGAIFTNVDFHLNAIEKTLTVTYGDNCIAFYLNSSGKLFLNASLVLGESRQKILGHPNR